MEPSETPRAADRPAADQELAARPQRVRREVWYEGRVQGVGFRYTTRQIAERFTVTGFVKNLPDGKVALVAEGEPEEIERFLAAVSAELGRYITGSRQRALAASDEFSAFDISF